MRSPSGVGRVLSKTQSDVINAMIASTSCRPNASLNRCTAAIVASVTPSCTGSFILQPSWRVCVQRKTTSGPCSLCRSGLRLACAAYWTALLLWPRTVARLLPYCALRAHCSTTPSDLPPAKQEMAAGECNSECGVAHCGVVHRRGVAHQLDRPQLPGRGGSTRRISFSCTSNRSAKSSRSFVSFSSCPNISTTSSSVSSWA